MDAQRTLILASRSPRRLQLLRQIGMSPTIMPCDIPEAFDAAKTPEENASSLALQKAECVAGSVREGVIIGADTIVVLDGEMLGKPENPRDAVRMLKELSGRTHTVVTGFALVERPSGRRMTGTERTEVTFRRLPGAEIEEYVAGGSPLDKAGAYGIQDDYGAVFVTRIEGCFYNVVGLPLSKFHTALAEFLSGNSLTKEGR
ncbi:MAG TPA: Maf family protein [Bacteroidota bacterium]|nr:Maf family protein [Bacteroidota bacterium]